MNDDISLNKNKSQNLCNACLYNPHYLIIQKKIVSQLIAFFLLLAFFIFALGYFLGKKKLAEDFSHIVNQANFSDQINFALTSLYEQENNAQKNQKDMTPVLASRQSNEDSQTKESIDTDALVNLSKENNPSSLYRAQLFGGTQKAVNQFAQRLAKKGIDIEIRTRTSKTTSGKKLVWYQAVSKPYANKLDLEAIVATIKKLEKINNVTILQVPA